MNVAESLKVVKAIQQRWYRQPIPKHAIDPFMRDLAPLPYADTLAAVEMIARDRRDFPPSSGDLARQVAESQVAPPEWDEVKQQLLTRQDEIRTFRAHPWTCTGTTETCDGSTWIVENREARPCECHPDYVIEMRRTDILDPLVRTWMDEGFATSSEIEAIGSGDTTTEAQCRDRWQSYATRLVRARMRATLPPPTEVPEVEAAPERGSLRRGSAAALGAAPADILAKAGYEQDGTFTPETADVQR